MVVASACPTADIDRIAGRPTRTLPHSEAFLSSDLEEPVPPGPSERCHKTDQNRFKREKGPATGIGAGQEENMKKT